MIKKVKTAVIPAAGLGTRFLPATKAVPKEMLPIVDRPTIELIIEECVRAGIERVVVIAGRHKHAIEDHFDHNVELESTLAARGKQSELDQLSWLTTEVEIISVRQKQALGLGHAVLCAKPVIGDEPFAVLLGDDLVVGDEPAIAPMIQQYESSGIGVVGIVEVAKDQVDKYGIVAPEKQERAGLWKAASLVEKPSPDKAPSQLAVIGRYVLPPSIWPLLESLGTGVGGEIQLTDALDALAASEGLHAMALSGQRFDAGTQAGFVMANIHFALERPDIAKTLLPWLKAKLGES